jgi:hypothetical protein
MKRVLSALAIAVAALVITATTAAVPPSSGATYAGRTTGHKSTKPIPVKLKVAADGKSLGGFSKSGNAGGAPLKVSGKFSSATRASGKFDTVICFAGKPSFAATT